MNSKPPFPSHFDPPILMLWVINWGIGYMKGCARHFPPNPPYIALKVVSWRDGRVGRRENASDGGPCLPDLHSQTWRDKRQHGARTLFPLLYHPAQWGILDASPPMLHSLINSLSCGPKPLPHREGSICMIMPSLGELLLN